MEKVKIALVAVVFLIPVAVYAGGTQIGTAPVLLAMGVKNIYGQFRIGDGSALVASYSAINGSYNTDTMNLTSYSLAYKGYFSKYANGGYWEIGAANFDVKSSTSSLFTANSNLMIPILGGGFESKYGNLVLNSEGGIGTSGGWGFIGFNAAYQF